MLHRPTPLLPPADPKSIPQREWLIPGALLCGHLNVLCGRGGAGKSLLALHWAVQVAAQVKWADWEPAKRGRVLVVVGEDDAAELQRRLTVICAEMRVPRVRLEGHMESVGPTPALVVRREGHMGAASAPARSEWWRQLSTLAPSYGLIIVDPLIASHQGLDENSNADMQAVAEALRDVARSSGAAILAVHHTHKHGNATDQDAARGASALVNAARVVVGVGPMSPDFAKKNGIGDASAYCQVAVSKSNHGRRNSGRWFNVEVREVGNGDAAPVLTPADEMPTV